MNNSQTGGYIRPISVTQPPHGLTLLQFLQTVLVGLSGLDGTLVRPKWQIKPPPQPDVNTNWLAFGIESDTPNFNAAVVTNKDTGVTTLKRWRTMILQLSFYGPNALDLIEQVQDGFQLGQNLAALTSAKMGLTETGQALHLPELVNEQWFERYEMSVTLQRLVQSVYPIVTIVGAHGTIYAPTAKDIDYSLDWNVPA